MQFLGDILVGFFSAYLALTNSIALHIENVLTPEAETQAVLQKISSAYDAIPSILIENAAYQQSSVIDGVATAPVTTDPLQALVNIYCTHATDRYTRTTTGTGFFIDTKGIIMTNAHVAQFLLLETVEGDTDCIVRSGNPAVPTYEVDLLYISPAWIQEHAALIDAENPSGTGERDYALLYVTAGLNNNPMPRYFPALAFDSTLVSINALNSTVIGAGYPAEALFAAGNLNGDLIPKKATTSITELMTFDTNYADLMTIAGSDIGEQGSSGGPVLNEAGQVIGMVSTKGDPVRFGEGALRALTLSYVDRTIREETGFSLAQSLRGNLPYRSKLFKETLGPFLRRMLERELRD